MPANNASLYMSPVAQNERQLPRSYWAATAGPQVKLDRLQGAAEADVVVVGGGFVGLRAALELSLKGTSVIVIDSEEPGYGASGRSGGQINPLPHILPDEVVKEYGSHHAEIFFAMMPRLADEVFDVIRTHGIDCENYQHGWIQAAHKPSKMRLLEARQKGWSRHGIDVEMVSRQEVMQKVGAPGYYGGAFFRRGGALHPMAFTRGLAHAVIKAGGRIFSKTSAESLARTNGRWQVSCNGGAAVISCENVVIATNGYTGRQPIPGLKRSILPVPTVLAASEPLSDEQLKIIMPGWTTLADTRRALFYTRRTGTNRIMLGGSAHNHFEVRDFERHRIDVGLRHVFPQLAGLKWDYCWSGIVALTADHLCHFHEPMPGVFVGLGFNGRGVAITTMMGRTLAERVLGAGPRTLPFPTMPMKIDPYALFGHLGLRIGTSYYETLDAVDNWRNRDMLKTNA